MIRCLNCGSTDIDDLEPLDNGTVYCGGCDRVTDPRTERRIHLPPERRRKDVDE